MQLEQDDFSGNALLTQYCNPRLIAAPLALIEPCRHNKDQNLVHAAALEGKGAFLSCTLLLKDDGTKEGDVRQKLAFSAVMAKDTANQTPLTLAIEERSSPVVKELFKCLQLLFSQQYSLPFTPLNEAYEIHLQEDFEIEVLVEALRVTPDLALSFVSQLSFVATGDDKVQGGVDKFNFDGRHHSQFFITGSKTRSPPGHWKAELKKLFGEVDHTDGDPVKAKICPLKGVASSDSEFLECLVRAAVSTKMYRVFENEVVKAVISHKWNSYVKSLFLKELGLDVAMVLSLTLDAILHPTIEIAPSVILTAVTLSLCLYFVLNEFSQAIQAESLREHYGGIWNVLDVLSLGSILLAYAVRFFISTESSVLVFAVALPLAYLNTLYYMQGFEESGKLVRMIIGITKGIGSFTTILTVCLVGFSFSFFILYTAGPGEYASAGGSGADEGDVVDGPYGLNNWAMSIFTGFLLLLGDFNAEEFSASASYGLTLTLFVVFMFFINIIMLNLLIAIMGDIFDQIQETADAQFMIARAQIVLEFEGSLSEADRNSDKNFPTWLQVLVPSLESESTDWQGRVKALKAAITRLEEKQAENEKKREESEKKRVETEKTRAEDVKRLEIKLEESEKKREAESRQIAKMLKLICANWQLEEKELERQLTAESNRLQRELGVTSDDLAPRPKNNTQKVERLKALKKKRVEESSRLEKEVEGLWKTLDVGEDD